MSTSEHIAVIGNGFEEWLESEKLASSTGRNSGLDDYQAQIDGMRFGYDSDKNISAAKSRSHLNRLPIWWQGFELDPEDDEQTGKIIFSALMFVSGAFRLQCYLQAENEQDYRLRRYQHRGIGISIPHVVGPRLRQLVSYTGKLEEAKINIDELDKEREIAARVGESALQITYHRVSLGKDLREESSLSVDRMLRAQHNWISFATSCVVLAAKIRGGSLSSVPVLEAKSISDVKKVIYPFNT